MRKYCLVLALATAVAAMLALPAGALAFQVTGGGGNQTQNAYGLWYAGQEACAQEGCHSAIAEEPTVHSVHVQDVKTYPQLLEPGLTSSLWPFTSPLGGLTIRARDVFLRVGGSYGSTYDYVGFSGSSLASGIAPADDLPLFNGIGFNPKTGTWVTPTAAVTARPYLQSCGGCHNLGVTRPSSVTTTLANGAMQSSATPSAVSAFGIQCEVCHGTGKNPSGHKTGVPSVVSGSQLLKAQVCGQCHVTGTAPQTNIAGSAFSSPNGYTTDATLTAFLTPITTVETEGVMASYLASGGTKPKFLPNGANYSMNHGIYNEWLQTRHSTSPRSSIASGSDNKCLRCHSGLGFLYRIGAKGPNGVRIVATEPTTATAKASDPGISCQVCHDGHVKFNAEGVESVRTWADGHEVSCGDCHNWRYEQMGLSMQHETINGIEYTRPPANSSPHVPAREVYAGGYGGDDGLSGLWGVAPMGEFMKGVKCDECHMPFSSAQGAAAPTGSKASHRFQVILPEDAERWHLKRGTDTCSRAECHAGSEVADWSLEDYQSWIDQQESSLASASAEASAALNALVKDFSLRRLSSFSGTQPATGIASTLDVATWGMLQHAAQNYSIVNGDGAGGLHNPPYSMAGLEKAAFWARSYGATITAALDAGPADGSGMTVRGRLLGYKDVVIAGAKVMLQTSTDGGSSWSTVATVSPDATGTFAAQTGRIVGSRLYRTAFAPSAGVVTSSTPLAVNVPVTTADVLPASAADGWADAPSALVTLSATPGSITFYTLSGATVSAQMVYTASGPITITAEGQTDVTYWSANAEGVEAPITLHVGLDRTAPLPVSDIVKSYAEKAQIRLTGFDSGSGIAKLEYALDSASAQTVPDSWIQLTVLTPGAHTLTLKAYDASGKTAERTWRFRVRATPRVTGMPTSVRVRRGYSWKLSATVLTKAGAPAGSKLVYIQRSSDGRSWKTVASARTSASGALAKWVKPTRSVSYWRVYVPSDASYYAAKSPRVKVVLR